MKKLISIITATMVFCTFLLSGSTANFNTQAADAVYTIILDRQFGSGGDAYILISRGEQLPEFIAVPTIPPTITPSINRVFMGYFTQVQGGTQVFTSAGRRVSEATWEGGNSRLFARWIESSETAALYHLNSTGLTEIIVRRLGLDIHGEFVVPPPVPPTPYHRFRGFFDEAVQRTATARINRLGEISSASMPLTMYAQYGWI